MWPLALLVTAGVALWAITAHAKADAASARVKALSQFGAQWSVLSPDAAGSATIPAGAYFAVSVSAASPQAPLLVQMFTQAIQSGVVKANMYPPGKAPPTWPDPSLDPTADSTKTPDVLAFFRVIGQVVAPPLTVTGSTNDFPVRIFTSPTRPALTFDF